MKAIIICLVFMISLVFTAKAQIYKWVDEKGVSHYSNKRPPSTVKKVHSRREYRNTQSHNQNGKEFDKLLKHYEKDSLQRNVSNPQPNGSKGIKSPNPRRLEYLKNRIKQKEIIVRRFTDDLIDVKRTPHKDYRSHKKKLRYHEDRLKHAQIDLEDAQSEYEDYKRVF